MKRITALLLVFMCLFAFAGCSRTEETTDIAKLREKYTSFFNISTDEGLIIYVWQMDEDDYRCYPVSRFIESFIDRSFAFEIGATIREMRTILTTYDIEKEDIAIQPIINPLSDYEYEINDEYRERVTELFWQD